MSLATIKAEVAKYADPIILALEMIQSMTGIGGTRTKEALVAIDAVLKTLEQGVAAQLSAADILAELNKLAPSEAADDAAAAAANAAELAKYPAEGA